MNRFSGLGTAALALFTAAYIMTASAHAEQTPLELDVPAYILVDAASGQTVCGKAEDEQRDMAGAIKIMTALVVEKAKAEGALSDAALLTVSRDAVSAGGMSAFLTGGGMYDAATLEKAMLMISANDAAIALAEFTAGSSQAFVARMDEQAQSLGINPVFVNPTGHKAAGQLMSPREAAAIACELVKHPAATELAGTYMDTLVHEGGRETELVNPNRLVRFYTGCDGLSTGSNADSGYSGVFTAQRDGQRYIAVVAGAENSKKRFDAAQKLLDHGFANFESAVIIEEGRGVCRDVPVAGGTVKCVHGVAQYTKAVLVRKGAEIKKEAVLSAKEFEAPIKKGDKLGEIIVTADGQRLCEIPIVAYEDVDKASVLNSFLKLAKDFIS